MDTQNFADAKGKESSQIAAEKAKKRQELSRYGGGINATTDQKDNKETYRPANKKTAMLSHSGDSLSLSRSFEWSKY